MPANESSRLADGVFHDIVDRTPDAIAIQADERIVYANAAMATLLGETTTTLIGRNIADFAAPTFRARVEQLTAGAAAHIQLIATGGKVRDVEVTCASVESGGGVVATIIARDISGASLQAALEQSNRVESLGRVAATIAHEFNNVLMAIQPYAEILRRRSADFPEVERPASQIIQAVQRGKRVTDELIRFTRPSEPVLEPLHLRDLLERLCAQIRELQLPLIDVRIEPPHEDIVIAGDIAQLAQVAMNLVVNARDAMPSGGTLSIGAASAGNLDVASLTAEERDAYAWLSFSDTGDGIPPEIIGRIFEPLFTTKTRGGTGLGLAVAQQIVSRHGGYLLATSPPGSGATFYMLLRKALA
jgi:PAS domain S-box-containing protein